MNYNSQIHKQSVKKSRKVFLPYKQRVGGSTPSAPTKKALDFSKAFFLCGIHF